MGLRAEAMRESHGMAQPGSIQREKRRIHGLVLIGMWTAVAAAVAGLERLLPTPVPWVRLGLANSVALVVLLTQGWRAAMAVNVLRVLVVALLFGTWGGPAFPLSLSGAVVATMVMGALAALPGRPLSPVGLSVAGAGAHISTQLVLVALLFIRHGGLLTLVGPSLLASTVSGFFTGMLALLLLRRLEMLRQATGEEGR